MGAALGKLFVDAETLPDNGFGFVQVLFLAVAYSYVLTIGGTMIKDGSELLLLVPSLAGLVGSVILPVLGAVPDGAIVLFSGLSDNAQQQLNVGIGALAGSTIMLLTVPWALSQYAGRVDFDPDGKGNYKRPHGSGKGWKKTTKGLLETGTNFKDDIRHAAFSMILTMLSMFVIQIPACFARCSLEDQTADCNTPKWAALTAGIMCVVFFCWYLIDQYRRAAVDVVVDAKIRKVQEQSLAQRIMSARVMFSFAESESPAAGAEGSPLMPAVDSPKFEAFVRRIFQKYDYDKSDSVDVNELAILLRDLGEPSDPASVDRFMKEVDENGDGQMSFKEFFSAMSQAATLQNVGELETKKDDNNAGGGQREGRPSSGFGTQVVTSSDARGDNENANAVARASDAGSEDGDEGEEEEDAEVPEDLAHLPPDEQRRRVLMRSGYLMGVGTVIVLLFSDPMVDILNDLGTRTGIRPFYVAFVLAPLVSNGSELIAAYAYAAKKTVASATISFSTLLGAACMNNTFCLAIFLFLVYARNLKWVFTAEVASMIFVELLMFGMIVWCGTSFKSQWMFFVIALLPVSLALVAGLEAGGLD